MSRRNKGDLPGTKRGKTWVVQLAAVNRAGEKVRVFAQNEDHGVAYQEALAKKKQLEAHRQPTKMTFNEFLDEYVAEKERDGCKAGTVKDHYKGRFALHVKPYLGERPLVELHTGDFQYWMKTLTDKGMTPAMRNKMMGIVRTALNRAIELEYIDKNPARAVKRVKRAGLSASKKGHGNAKFPICTKAQLERLYFHASKVRYGEVIVIAARTGMRAGEILALQMDDVDLVAKTVRIKATLEPHGLTLQSPKTESSKRTISIDDATVAAFQSWLKKRSEEKNLDTDKHHPDTGFMFLSRYGRPVQWSNFLSDGWKKSIREAGLDKIVCEDGVVRSLRFHDLRHTHATMLIRAGHDITGVSARLGHHDPAITLSLYTHVNNDAYDSEKLREFDGLLGTVKPAEVTVSPDALRMRRKRRMMLKEQGATQPGGEA